MCGSDFAPSSHGFLPILHPKNQPMDTMNDDLENVSPFNYGNFEYQH